MKIKISITLILYHLVIGLLIVFFGFNSEKWYLAFIIYLIGAGIIISYLVLDERYLKAKLLKILKRTAQIEDTKFEKDELFPMIEQLLIQQQLSSNSILTTYNEYKKQTETILEYISRGLAILDYSGDFIFFNSYFSDFLKVDKSQIYKNYKIVIRDYELKKMIEKTYQSKEQQTKDIEINQKLFQVKIVLLAQEKREQILIIIRDLNDHKLLENVKRDFFSYASHELKTPITAIKGYSELIEHQMVNPEEVIKISKEINHLTEIMNLLVEDMLMLSRLEYSKDGLRKDIFLNDILEEVIKQLKPQMEEKNIILEMDYDKVEYFADPIDMLKLFKNLIENAIKYNKKDGSIKISLKSDETGVRFIVKDSGMGIKDEHKVRVFERFYRVSQGREILGTGLGLAIVKHIVLNYDGKIVLNSVVNEYTEFIILLPKTMKK
ncbi:sensor histidine kinase [Acholeplasma palmae]|uniref:sensor histidine kinase n=1 Tax=Acholeplasma palmae TaxID=38986 RepID=UPI0005F9ABFF|nr:ATP-binding protein [Alteracholeplasma palmae]